MSLKFHDDVTFQSRVIEEKVGKELISGDFQPELPPLAANGAGS
jgi:hypothetical protein